MRHCRSDYEAIQPWPIKRPHHVKIDGGLTTIGDVPLNDPAFVAAVERGTITPIIPDDEPVFILRAKDRTAPAIVRAWATAQLDDPDGDHLTAYRVREFADEMEAYAAAHYNGGKLADTPAHLLVP